jgi:hypothetical protein
LIVPLSFLGGVFYSVATLPSRWREVSQANPIFDLVQTVRYGFLGTSDVPVGIALVITGAARIAHRRLGHPALPRRAQAQALTVAQGSGRTTSSRPSPGRIGETSVS